MAQLKVYIPEGYPPNIDQLKMAERPGVLDGKTVYPVDRSFDDGDILTEQMGNWSREHMPRVDIEIRRKYGTYHQRDYRLYEKKTEETVVVGGETNGYWRIFGNGYGKTVSVDDWR
ncbi:TPA: hypothetical protein DCE37_18310 [Candidatus Latescibacteria bacterium]|nr:hypothetical protein [Candidatus Latescibacterota bacterium]